jgi:hypothetical protein
VEAGKSDGVKVNVSSQGRKERAPEVQDGSEAAGRENAAKNREGAVMKRPVKRIYLKNSE